MKEMLYITCYYSIVEETTGTLKTDKAIPATSHGGPEVSEETRLPHFLGKRLTDGSHSLSEPQGHSVAEIIRSI
jgi:hypothetical protein